MGINIGDNNVFHGDVIDNSGGDGPGGAPVSFVGVFIAVIIVVGLAINYWQITLAVVGVAALTLGYWMEWQDKKRAEANERARQAALARRAEDQNSAYLRGDTWGVFGNFPPEAKP